MPRPHPTAPTLAAVALVAGVLQVMATVMLGLASLEELRAAAAEGARPYLLGILAALLGLVVAWLLRRRPLWALATLVVWQSAVLWPLHQHASTLGLAYHGEYVLHHFTGLIAAATCITIGGGWLRNPELGRGRWLPGGLAVLGTLALVAAHVAEQPGLGSRTMPWLERGGAVALLLAWGTAVPLLWRHLGPARLRTTALVLLLPFAVRVAFSWPEGLAGASVIESGRVVLMLSMVIAAGWTFAMFRPPLAPPVRALVLGFSGLATVLLYYFYRHGFGELEAGLGGFAQSMFAFSVPYPTYVPAYQVWVVMLGLFAMFGTAYAGLVSPGQRVRGLALSLLVVTGLGLSTPPLVMMTGAAALLWIDSLLGAGPGARRYRAPQEPMEAILGGTADRVGLPEVVVLDEGDRQLLALRGELRDAAIDLRARPTRSSGWEVTLTVGTLGRGRADMQLVPEPGDDGPRPAHALGRTHLAQGRVRDLELLDDGLLDALLPFSQARVEVWAAGTRVRLGDDLSQLDEQTLGTLLFRLSARE